MRKRRKRRRRRKKKVTVQDRTGQLTLKSKMWDDACVSWYGVDTFSSSQIPHLNTVIIPSSGNMVPEKMSESASNWRSGRVKQTSKSFKTIRAQIYWMRRNQSHVISQYRQVNVLINESVRKNLLVRCNEWNARQMYIRFVVQVCQCVDEWISENKIEKWMVIHPFGEKSRDSTFFRCPSNSIMHLPDRRSQNLAHESRPLMERRIQERPALNREHTVDNEHTKFLLMSHQDGIQCCTLPLSVLPAYIWNMKQTQVNNTFHVQGSFRGGEGIRPLYPIEFS